LFLKLLIFLVEATLILFFLKKIKIQKNKKNQNLKKEEGKVEGLVWSNILPINISIQQTKKGGEQKKKRGIPKPKTYFFNRGRRPLLLLKKRYQREISQPPPLFWLLRSSPISLWRPADPFPFEKLENQTSCLPFPVPAKPTPARQDPNPLTTSTTPPSAIFSRPPFLPKPVPSLSFPLRR
jgi:hypothetical protein